MNSEMHTGTTIRDLEKLSDGMFNVEEFRKSLLSAPKGKLLQFPSPVVEVSPAQVVTLEDQLTAPVKPFDIHDIMRDLFAPIPSWLKDGE
jgi:hypothetical protein